MSSGSILPSPLSSVSWTTTGVDTLLCELAPIDPGVLVPLDDGVEHALLRLDSAALIEGAHHRGRRLGERTGLRRGRSISATQRLQGRSR
jgi:hypothetical protein